MNKYEKLIEYIVNEQEDKAKELFHQLVVEKSRDIYESLMDEEDLNEFGGNPVADLADEVSADDEGFEADDEDDMGGDEESPEEEEAEEEGLEDKVMDLEAALDDLRAEFDALMSDEEGEGEHNDGDMDPDFGDEEEEEAVESASVYESSDEDADDEDLEESEDEDEELDEDDEVIREYVEKVAQPAMKSEGGEVAASSASAAVNKKSPALQKKNDMGGSSANIVKGGDEGGNPTGPKGASNAYAKGQKEDNMGNRNVPGGKADSLEKAPKAKTRGE